MKCINCNEEIIEGQETEVWTVSHRGEPEHVIGHICSECIGEGYHTCYETGKVYPEEDMEFVHDIDEWVNISSLQNGDYERCEDCGEWFTRDNMHVDDNTAVCDRCYDRYCWHTCDECGALVPDGEGAWDDDSDMFLCDSCYDEVMRRRPIHQYGYKPSPIFRKTDDEPNTHLFMGVEMEIDNGGNRNDCACALKDGPGGGDESLFYMKYDCSLDEGIEIVTQPCTLSFHLAQFPWQGIRDVARRYSFVSHDTTTCGFHVHVSRRGLGEDQTAQDLTIAKIIIMVDRMWDKFVKFSRRNYNRLDQWAKKPDAYIDKTDSAATAIRKSKNCADTRYCAVNLTNWNTVEFRLFRGTLNVNTIKATLELLGNLIEFAMKRTLDEVQNANWEDITGLHVYPELNRYLEERGLITGASPLENIDTDGDIAA